MIAIVNDVAVTVQGQGFQTLMKSLIDDISTDPQPDPLRGPWEYPPRGLSLDNMDKSHSQHP